MFLKPEEKDELGITGDFQQLRRKFSKSVRLILPYQKICSKSDPLISSVQISPGRICLITRQLRRAAVVIRTGKCQEGFKELGEDGAVQGEHETGSVQSGPNRDIWKRKDSRLLF